MTPMAPGDPFGRELVADDPEGEGEHGPSHALDDAADQHHRQRGGQPGDQGPDRQRDEDGDDHAFLAHHVADAAEDRRRNGSTEEVGGQQPARRALRGVERALELGNGRDDQRLEQAEGQRRRGQDRERGDVVAPVAGHGRVASSAQTTTLTSRGGRTTTRRGEPPSKAAATFSEASATASASDSEIPASTSIRSRSFPLTWITIVTVS